MDILKKKCRQESDTLCKQIREQMYDNMSLGMDIWEYESCWNNFIFKQRLIRHEKCLLTEKCMNEVFKCTLLVIQHKSLANMKILVTVYISGSFSKKKKKRGNWTLLALSYSAPSWNHSSKFLCAADKNK